MSYLYYKLEIKMLSVRLDETLQTKLNNLANITKRPKSFFVKEALSSYLEDMEDYLEVQKRNQDPTQHLISLEELDDYLLGELASKRLKEKNTQITVTLDEL